MVSGDDTISVFRSTLHDGGDPVEVTVPRNLGPIEIKEKIGQGGMGVVFKAYHSLLDRYVAAKFLLRPSQIKNDPAFDQFVTTARVAAKASHENLCTLLHADVIHDTPYLIMEFVDGPTLQQLLSAQVEFDLSESLSLLIDVVEGVNQLHAEGIIHRDIKPANIMLDDTGQVFVTDFGLACQRPLREPSGIVTEFAGTPAYMAPEMFDGAVSPRTDVYAIGVTAFKLLTGKSPFKGSLTELARRFDKDPIPRKILEQSNVPPALIEVLERATQNKPLYRYKSAGALGRALGAAARDLDIQLATREHLAELIRRAEPTTNNSEASGTKSTTPTSSYYDKMTEIVGTKQKERVREGQSGRQTVEASIGPTVTDHHLLFDLECVNCNYNLRLLSYSQDNCPECGIPVKTSVFTDDFIEWYRSKNATDTNRRFTFGRNLYVRFVNFVILAGSIVALLAFVYYWFSFR